jgi:hypothetical protein
VGQLRQLLQRLPLGRSGLAQLVRLASERPGLRLAQQLACFHEPGQRGALAAGKLVDGPDRNRRLGQLFDLGRSVVAPCLLQAPREIVPGRGELGRQKGVQAVQLLIEIRHDGERLRHICVVATASVR